MADPDENAAIVNALQRHATVVVQKSLADGFGLIVAEAICKQQPSSQPPSAASRIRSSTASRVSYCQTRGIWPRLAMRCPHSCRIPSAPVRSEPRRESASASDFLGPRHLARLFDLIATVTARRASVTPVEIGTRGSR
jgi:trehalose synthase